MADTDHEISRVVLPKCVELVVSENLNVSWMMAFENLNVSKIKMLQKICQAEGQMLAWPRKSRWTYGILGKELVAEGRSRLRRFRGYVRKPGTWQSPSWKEETHWDSKWLICGRFRVLYLILMGDPK